MNNKKVSMVLVDTIWIGLVYASMLVVAIIMGFIVFKVGIVSLKVVMGTVMATRGIENIKGVAKHHNHQIKEENEIKIITSYIKAEIEKNHYAKYAYIQLFKK